MSSLQLEWLVEKFWVDGVPSGMQSSVRMFSQGSESSYNFPWYSTVQYSTVQYSTVLSLPSTEIGRKLIQDFLSDLEGSSVAHQSDRVERFGEFRFEWNMVPN